MNEDNDPRERMKVCRTCGITKPDAAYNKSRGDCRKCQRDAWKVWKSESINLAKTMISGARRRAQKHHLAFDLTPEDIVIPTRCPVLNIPLRSGEEAAPNSPSLDRINPDLGYIRGNIIVISHLANTIKSNASPEQIRKVADWLQHTRESSLLEIAKEWK